MDFITPYYECKLYAHYQVTDDTIRNLKLTGVPSGVLRKLSHMKNLGMRLFFKKIWGPRRELPKFAEKSFRELWIKKNS